MISFAHFTKQSCTITDILITPESQYSYRKRITRGHIMFVFKTDKVPFTELHCTLESYPGFLLEFQHTHTHKIWREKKKDIYTDSRGSNIFLKVTLWSSKIWTVIFFFVASCLISERWAWWGSMCAGLGGGKLWSQRGTWELWPQWVRAQVQGALVRGTRVSETRLILEWPTMKMARGVAV